ncbi:MAG TPA: FHA domain-containing protein [Polyangiales bacterium]|nr:FHA domain-containing protein [Polyangiales bacterium]
MDQPALIVQLQRSHLAPEEQFRFERSPVHIGRGPRNELLIDHVFVSHQHGVLHFDGSGVDYIDVGSTNGSFLDGVRLESHRFNSVPTGALLNLGTLRLRVTLDVRAHRRATERELPAPSPSAAVPGVSVALANLSLENSGQAASLAAVIERFAESFLALSRDQRAWRERLGLARPSRSGLHALEDPVALIAYLLTPGHETSRLEELEVACEELLCNERALVRAIGQDPYPLEEP